MKKRFSLILSIIMLLSTFNTIYASVDTPVRGIVVDILDGEALVMKFNNTTAKVKLIGVKTNASEEAYKYMIDNIKGKYAYLQMDDFYNSQRADSIYTLAYIFMYDTGEMLNQTLLRNGLAEIDSSHSNATYYSTLSHSKEYAYSSNNGIWSTNTTGSDYVNINTASALKLKTLLEPVDAELANAIVNYRTYNYFNTVSELKFVDGMTKSVYDLIKNKVTVCTNINKASEYEFLTLKNLTQNDVDNIINYREKKGNFSYISQIQTKAGLSSSKYKSNSDFISVEYKNFIDDNSNNLAVNINTATANQIANASNGIISTSEAKSIVEAREKGYSYKTLGELMKLDNLELTQTEINKIEDNLHLYTDINNASTNELKSLFGSSSNASSLAKKIEDARPFNNISEFKKIVDLDKYGISREYIYIDEYELPKRININLASIEKLQELNLTSVQLNTLKRTKGSMTDFNDIKIDIEDIDDMISLYTNINKATKSELMTLGDMTENMAESIITYRTSQPFGSKTEIKEFFKSKNQLSFYNQIEDFITFR